MSIANTITDAMLAQAAHKRAAQSAAAYEAALRRPDLTTAEREACTRFLAGARRGIEDAAEAMAFYGHLSGRIQRRA